MRWTTAFLNEGGKNSLTTVWKAPAYPLLFFYRITKNLSLEDMQALLVDSITCSFSVKNMKKTGIAGHKKGISKCIGTIEAILQFCVFLLEKNILYCFAGRKYSEHFDLIFSCWLWTVRIIYLNLLLLLLLLYLRETLLFQGSFGFRLFFFINL